MIDLRSDTVPRPSKGMLEAMMNAQVGNDVFQEDPSKKFQKYARKIISNFIWTENEFIKKARRGRKVLGEGMRQAGFLAAAANYALDHHIQRLKEDHIRVKKIAKDGSLCNSP